MIGLYIPLENIGDPVSTIYVGCDVFNANNDILGYSCINGLGKGVSNHPITYIKQIGVRGINIMEIDMDLSVLVNIIDPLF